MCGIAGIWKDEHNSSIKRMVSNLNHRGPDGIAYWNLNKDVHFGHCRLAIMDPQGGKQPLHNEDGSLTIIVNGEIYNYPHLFEELSSRHAFHTGSDSEVILHLYEELGDEMITSLEGMFAFAITDGNHLILARDPIGIKPLYVGYKGDGLVHSILFASEMKALTPYVDHLNEFPPGNLYTSSNGFQQYYTLPSYQEKSLTLEKSIRLIREEMEKCVAKLLMSDVPVGVFLSGGLDSAIVAALARRHIPDLHTFAVGIEGSTDIVAARQVAESIDSIHHEYLFTGKEVMEELPRIIYHLESFDQDLVRSAIPCYFCSKLAADHVKVVLTGEGADELFAGYHYYKEFNQGANLHNELRRSIASLHNINLQRLDRMSMAHGLEGRVPFLEKSMIELGLSIPAAWKIQDDGFGQLMEKWILRKAFTDLLPPEILWRRKEQFDEGSGTVKLLKDMFDGRGTPNMKNEKKNEHAEPWLRSLEESFYYRLFTMVFERYHLLLPNVGRWSKREESQLAN